MSASCSLFKELGPVGGRGRAHDLCIIFTILSCLAHCFVRYARFPSVLAPVLYRTLHVVPPSLTCCTMCSLIHLLCPRLYLYEL